jgi:hypothetical protein
MFMFHRQKSINAYCVYSLSGLCTKWSEKQAILKSITFLFSNKITLFNVGLNDWACLEFVAAKKTTSSTNDFVFVNWFIHVVKK